MAIIRKRIIQSALDDIEKALRATSMEDANFNPMCKSEHIPPKKASDVTNYIKDKTELYRYSWIASPLRRALSTLKSELERVHG